MDNFSIRELGVRLVVSIIGLILILRGALYGLELYFHNTFPQSVSNGIITILIGITTVVLVYISNRGFEYLHESRGSLTAHQKEVSYRFIQISAYLTAGLFAITAVWDINLANVLIGAGALGILAGLAAREALSSVLAGIIIMGTNMFKVGDWLQFEDKFGKVTKITFFNTHFISQHGEKHIIPNNSLTSKNITNISAQGRYRKDLVVGVDYGCDIQRVLDVCNDELSELRSDTDNNHIVGFQQTSVKDFSGSSIELAIKVWIKDPTPMMINQTQTEVFQRIHNRFDEENIDIPFEQVTISHRNSNQRQSLNSQTPVEQQKQQTENDQQSSTNKQSDLIESVSDD